MYRARRIWRTASLHLTAKPPTDRAIQLPHALFNGSDLAIQLPHALSNGFHLAHVEPEHVGRCSRVHRRSKKRSVAPCRTRRRSRGRRSSCRSRSSRSQSSSHNLLQHSQTRRRNSERPSRLVHRLLRPCSHKAPGDRVRVPDIHLLRCPRSNLPRDSSRKGVLRCW